MKPFLLGLPSVIKRLFVEVLSLSMLLQMDTRQDGGHTSQRTTHPLPGIPDSRITKDVIICKNVKIYEGAEAGRGVERK